MATVPVAPVPASGSARGVLRWLWTSNPFYVLSAGLFLAGLWLSFGAQEEDAETWALMSGLAGYTFLLAATGCFLVRLAHVWDDVRTVLLLVVLMFLAISVTFDEVLVMKPELGYICSVLGFLLAVESPRRKQGTLHPLLALRALGEPICCKILYGHLE